jgi:hypothetical protein
MFPRRKKNHARKARQTTKEKTTKEKTTNNPAADMQGCRRRHARMLDCACMQGSWIAPALPA